MPGQRKAYLYGFFVPVRLFIRQLFYSQGLKNLWLKKEAPVTAEINKSVILSFPEFLLNFQEYILFHKLPGPSHTHKKEETAWTE